MSAVTVLWQIGTIRDVRWHRADGQLLGGGQDTVQHVGTAAPLFRKRMRAAYPYRIGQQSCVTALDLSGRVFQIFGFATFCMPDFAELLHYRSSEWCLRRSWSVMGDAHQGDRAR